MLKWWWSTILCDVEGDDSKFDHGLLQKYPQAATIMDSCFLASAVSWRQMQPLSLATSQKRHGSFFLTPRERPKAPWILRNLFCSFFTGRILFHQTSRLNSVERLMFGNSPPSFRKNIFPEPEKNEGFPPKKHFFFFSELDSIRSHWWHRIAGEAHASDLGAVGPARPYTGLGFVHQNGGLGSGNHPQKMPEPFRELAETDGKVYVN